MQHPKNSPRRRLLLLFHPAEEVIVVVSDNIPIEDSKPSPSPSREKSNTEIPPETVASSVLETVNG
jgi:hypothetical protein